MAASVLLLKHPVSTCCGQGAKVIGSVMDLTKIMSGRTAMRRGMALLACAALFYFAAGGSFLHEHTKGPDTACHICQALHMPALAAAPLDLVSTPEIVTSYCSLPQHVAPSDSFALHRAGRAPPSA
jgi:hypothetical protein